MTYAVAATRPPRRRVRRSRLVWGYVLAVAGTALLVALMYGGRGPGSLSFETMVMMALVVGTALVGGLTPAVLGAVLAGLALNLFFTPPYGTLAIADPGNAVSVVVFLVTGVAVATVVDRAARTTDRARLARAEADTLAALSRGLVRAGWSTDQILVQACETLGLTGAALARTAPDGAVTLAAEHGHVDVGFADASIAVSPGVALLLHGRELGAADQALVTAYAAHLAVLGEREAAAEGSVHAAELAAGNRTRTALLTAVSHDLRSPLASVKAAVSSLRSPEVVWTPTQQAELLGAIEDGADRLDNLVGNLLDLSRLQLGAVNPLVTDTDLGEAVAWSLAGVPGGDAVRVEVGPDVPEVSVDPGLLERVLANLVENAMYHTPAGTPVCVGVARGADRGDRAEVRVVDHGPGVPSGLREALFAPFQRLGDVPAGDGLGLGLAVARGLTEAMGGTVRAEPTPGGGLTMVVDLPVAVGAGAR